MKTCQYIAAKRAINNHIPIAQETYDGLIAMRNQFQKRECECTTEGDTSQAEFFNNSKMAVNDLIERATIAEPEGE